MEGLNLMNSLTNSMYFPKKASQLGNSNAMHPPYISWLNHTPRRKYTIMDEPKDSVARYRNIWRDILPSIKKPTKAITIFTFIFRLRLICIDCIHVTKTLESN